MKMIFFPIVVLRYLEKGLVLNSRQY